jgi:hypothetical protein
MNMEAQDATQLDRIAALEALVSLGPATRSITGELLQIAGDRRYYTEVRLRALDVIAASGSASRALEVTLIELAVRVKVHRELRRRAVEVLGTTFGHSRRVHAVMETLLLDADKDVAIAAADALFNTTGEISPCALDALRDVLDAHLAKHDAANDVVQSVAAGLDFTAKVGSAARTLSPQLVAMTQDASPILRSRARKALAAVR